MAIFRIPADPTIGDALRAAAGAVIDGTPEEPRYFLEVGRYEVDGWVSGPTDPRVCGPTDPRTHGPVLRRPEIGSPCGQLSVRYMRSVSYVVKPSRS